MNAKRPLPPMRSRDEVYLAHDTLEAIALGEVPNPFWYGVERLAPALDVLCWVLHHDHNRAFAENLSLAQDFLANQGYVLSRGPDVEDGNGNN